MNPVTPLFPDGSSSQQLWFKFFPDEEIAVIWEMPNDVRGLFLSFRLYALTHQGFTADPDELWSRAKFFAGVSRYKFKKLLPIVLQYFEKFDGKFFYSRDEQRVDESRDRVRNYQKRAEKGANARWRNGPDQGPQPITQPDGSSIPRAMPLEGVEGLDKKDSTAASTSLSMAQASAAAAAADAQTASKEILKTDEYHEFSTHCASPPQSLPVPSRDLAEKLKRKFLNQKLSTLPKFPKQETAAFWLSLPVEQVLAEAHRQKILNAQPSLDLPRRKPTERELTDQAVLARAAERDRKAGRS